MKAFLAFSLAAAFLLMPAIGSAEITREYCMNYCDTNRSETTNSCKSPMAKALGKKSVRDCYKYRDEAYANCK